MERAIFTVKNYRCFEDTSPLHFTLEDGFIAFVGPNNSGKSSVLRFFYEFRNFFTSFGNPGALLNALKGNGQGFNGFVGANDLNEVFCNLNSRDLQLEIQFPNAAKIQFVLSRDASARATLLPDGKSVITLGNSSQLNGSLIKSPTVVFDLAPMLELFQMLAQMIYIGPFRNAINVGGTKSYFDIHIGTDFIAIWDQWKTGPIKTQNETILKISNDIKLLFGYESLEITTSASLKTLQINANQKSYKLGELGSGIAQIIMILGNVATKSPSFILLDEPELNLHPSLQLDFLTTLASYARNGVIFATHSIGLARASAEKIYSVKNIKGKSRITTFETTSNLSEFLGELSFAGFKDLGYDRIFLVEGVTEVKTMHQFLRMKKKDHEFVVLPLGGAQLINSTRDMELGEIKRLSNNIVALIDSELSASTDSLSKDRKDFLASCEKLGITAHVLDRRAIENYLTESAIKSIKGPKFKALAHYEKLGSIPLAWAKNENWLIARNMEFDDIKDTDLGIFLDKITNY